VNQNKKEKERKKRFARVVTSRSISEGPCCVQSVSFEASLDGYFRAGFIRRVVVYGEGGREPAECCSL
jgi:hypothetical protein